MGLTGSTAGFDLKEMRSSLATHSGARAILEAFTKYLFVLKKPRAVELDDVTRIALQLNAAGFWDELKPEFFLKNIRSVVDADVVNALRDALSVNQTMENASVQNDWSDDVSNIIQRLAPPKTAQRGVSPLVKGVPVTKALGGVKPASTVTLKHLAATLASENELSRKHAEAILGGLIGQIVKHLKKGERIRIGGLGILQVRKRATRMGRNPATGEAIQIKASKKVAFRASKELKEAI
jgi:DNA-binding protein HU-beta